MPTSITSPGSGSASLGNIQYQKQSSDNTAAGALLGGLLGMAMQAQKNNAAKTASSSTPAPKPVTPSGGASGSGGAGGTSGSGTSYVSPTNSPWTGSTPGGLGTYIGGGGTGTAGGASFPPGTTQDQINADLGMTNGQPNYVISGVNMSSGQVIAQPNYNIVGGNLTTQGGLGVDPSATATPPEDQTAGTYFQDSNGNIYDGSGNLYAMNVNDNYYVNLGGGEWQNVNNGQVVEGWDPGTPTDFYNTEDYFSQPDTSWTDYLNSDSVDASGGDYYNTEDYFSSPDTSIFKDGGLATPMFADGGSVPRFTDGGSTGILSAIENLLSNWGVTGAIGGGLLGSLISGSGGSDNQISQGVDMSTVGRIAPRTTTFGMGPTNVVSNYGAPDTTQYADIAAALGAPTQNLAVNVANTGYHPLGTTDLQNNATSTSTGGLGTINYGGGTTGGGTGGTTGGTTGGGNVAHQGGQGGLNQLKNIQKYLTQGYKNENQYTKAQQDIQKILGKAGGIDPYTQQYGQSATDMLNAFLESQYTAPTSGEKKSYFTYGTPVDATANLTTTTGGLDTTQLSPVNATPTNDQLQAYTDMFALPESGYAMKDGGVPEGYEGDVPLAMGRQDYRHGAPVRGAGDGQSDDIPAMLADGEYVIDAESVSALGNGSNKAGAEVLDNMRHALRKHKRSAPLDSIPPKAKSPLQYMAMGEKMKGRK